MTFILSKILWMFAAPGNLLTLLLVLGSYMAMAQRKSWQILGRRLCFCVALAFFLIAILPVGDWMLLPLENRFPPVKPDHVDGIILLGGDENPLLTEARDAPSVRSSASRYIAFTALAHEYPQAKLVYTGGSAFFTHINDMSDADIAKKILSTLGFSSERVTFEDKSRNTHENAFMSAVIVHPKPQQKWLLVTSAYHMPRAMGCFRKAGWDVYPAPADYASTGKLTTEVHFNLVEHLLGMTSAIHEYAGLIGYWLMGYISSPWPK